MIFKFMRFFFVFLVLGTIIFFIKLNLKSDNEISVLLVCNKALMQEHSGNLNAYKSVLQEEGVPFKIIEPVDLLSKDTKDILKINPVIIFPDNLAHFLPKDIKFWIEDYTAKGGNIAVIYDPGIKNKKGAFLKEAIFSKICGVNYITYTSLRDDCYAKGFIEFKDDFCANYFQVPQGKIYKGNLLSGYSYGSLEYFIARNEIKSTLNLDDIYAYAKTDLNKAYPALILKKYFKGNVLYVNFPLSSLKIYSDDMPIRVILRTFLFKTAKIPHVLNTPYGKGGIVFNWHIDSNIDWKSISYMVKNGYLRKGLEYSMHITAGNFRDKSGDGLGFDAEGKGKKFVKDIMNYGIIGSHGGWAHNWFSDNIEKGFFHKEDIKKYIQKNNDVLQNITGYKITEYAAPNGVHNQPDTTNVLEELGFNSYYYTGDSGSAPNRTFFNGVMVSNNVIAFPIMPFGKSASFYEMKKHNRTEKEVENWLISTIKYAIDNRTIRLVYSHPYDIEEYPKAIKNALDYAQKMQKDGKLFVKPMSYFASFIQNFLKIEYEFILNKGHNVNFKINNLLNTKGITVCLPKDKYKKPLLNNCLNIQEDEIYYYIVLKDGQKNLSLEVND